MRNDKQPMSCEAQSTKLLAEFQSINGTGIINIKVSQSTDTLIFDDHKALIEAVDEAAASDVKVIVFIGGHF